MSIENAVEELTREEIDVLVKWHEERERAFASQSDYANAQEHLERVYLFKTLRYRIAKSE